MSTTALWLTVLALGLYHGLNPGMGWPLAVANGMAQARAGAVFATLLPLGGGHFLAIAVALLPFAWLSWYAQWSQSLRLGAGVLVLLFGLYKLVHPRHPRLLARIPPARLAWWSFLMATAHGAGLMLVPFMLGLCTSAPSAAPGMPGPTLETGHAAVMAYLARTTAGTALLVAAVHAAATMLAGVAMAWLVYRYLGLRFLRQAWLNLDAVWGASLVLAGAAGIWLAL